MRHITVAFAVAFLLTARLMSAQHPATPAAPRSSSRASLSGVVLDDDQLTLPSVAVTVIHAQTGAQTTTVSDADGAFAFPALQAGTYSVLAELPGFHVAEIRDVRLRRGEARSIPVSLTLEPIRQALVVIQRR